MTQLTEWRRSLASTEAPELPCPGDAFPTLAARQLALDEGTDLVGEIMPDPVPAHLCDGGTTRTVWLRPVGGGCEWAAERANVRIIGGQS